MGGSEVSRKTRGVGGQSRGFVSGVWRVGERTGLGVTWRSLASVGGIWVLVRRTLIVGSGSRAEGNGVPSWGQRAGELSAGRHLSVRSDESEGKDGGLGPGTLTTSSIGSRALFR